MTELDRIENGAVKLFLSRTAHETVPEDSYSRFAFPRLIKLMRFEVRRFRVHGFGHMMTMHTRTLFGMELLTMSFMPFEGNSVPYLLIDIMKAGKKRLIYTEYYDCTAEKQAQPLLEAVCEKYRHVRDYAEKPAWYVGERTGYSLIKSLGEDCGVTISKIAADSIRAYKQAAFAAEKSSANLAGLPAFRERMIAEGNPSSGVLKMVFGEKGAADFFKKCVMPDK